MYIEQLFHSITKKEYLREVHVMCLALLLKTTCMKACKFYEFSLKWLKFASASVFYYRWRTLFQLCRFCEIVRDDNGARYTVPLHLIYLSLRIMLNFVHTSDRRPTYLTSYVERYLRLRECTFLRDLTWNLKFYQKLLALKDICKGARAFFYKVVRAIIFT